MLTRFDPKLTVNHIEKLKVYYFSGVEFCIDFDEVWPIVYCQKKDAIAALTRHFTEGQDYVLDADGLLSEGRKQKGRRGGHNRHPYFLKSSVFLKLCEISQTQSGEEVRRLFTFFEMAKKASREKATARLTESVGKNLGSLIDLIYGDLGLENDVENDTKRSETDDESTAA